MVGAGGVDKCAPSATTGNEGAVYVYVRDAQAQTPNWQQEAVLFAPDAEKDFYFGGIAAPPYDSHDALDLQGDTALIGAIGARPVDSGGPRQGSVYAFRRVGTEWLEASRFFSSTRRVDGQLGLGVELLGRDRNAIALDFDTGPTPGIHLFERPASIRYVAFRYATHQTRDSSTQGRATAPRSAIPGTRGFHPSTQAPCSTYW